LSIGELENPWGHGCLYIRSYATIVLCHRPEQAWCEQANCRQMASFPHMKGHSLPMVKFGDEGPYQVLCADHLGQKVARLLYILADGASSGKLGTLLD
jgi:hypothetical protein